VKFYSVLSAFHSFQLKHYNPDPYTPYSLYGTHQQDLEHKSNENKQLKPQ
jgi:hypothetical protein